MSCVSFSTEHPTESLRQGRMTLALVRLSCTLRLVDAINCRRCFRNPNQFGGSRLSVSHPEKTNGISRRRAPERSPSEVRLGAFGVKGDDLANVCYLREDRVDSRARRAQVMAIPWGVLRCFAATRLMTVALGTKSEKPPKWRDVCQKWSD